MSKQSPIVLTASVIGLCPTLSKLVGLGGAKVLVKLAVPGRLTYLDDSRARACCPGLFGHYFSRLSVLFSF